MMSDIAIRAENVDVANDQVRFLAPLDFFDFVALERWRSAPWSASGTVQEECCIFHVPNVTLCDVTERPETIECGRPTAADDDLPALEPAVIRRIQQACAWETSARSAGGRQRPDQVHQSHVQREPGRTAGDVGRRA